jgi:hypothetical protein
LTNEQQKAELLISVRAATCIESLHRRKVQGEVYRALIREINRAPEDVLQKTPRYLQAELRRHRSPLQQPAAQTTGLYADYWNQFIGAFAGEEWERPPQGTLERCEAW